MKAKIKPLAELPEHHKCCSRMISQLTRCSSQVVEVDPKPFMHQFSNCLYCGKSPGNLLTFRLIDGRGYFPVDSADIDEGSLNLIIYKTLTVTALDISTGRELQARALLLEQNQAECCPVALAAKRELNLPLCSVGYASINVYQISKGNWRKFTRSIQLPPAARKFVMDFDLNKPVGPISFEVEV